MECGCTQLREASFCSGLGLLPRVFLQVPFHSSRSMPYAQPRNIGGLDSGILALSSKPLNPKPLCELDKGLRAREE